MSSDVAIRCRNLGKVYRIYEKPEHRLIQMATLGRARPFHAFAALHDVSLEVRRGETVGIVGRNGCGKSTLLQIICGTLQPSSGTVETHGRVAALLELGAGFNSEFTGRENVHMNGAILGFSRAEMNARFAAIAAFADIGDFIERPVKTYSSGMFVRLAFATAISVDPDILIVDEALSVGDEAFQRKCFARIEQIKERGGTILFVSHGAQSIVQLCDRAILLDGGQVLYEGHPKRTTSLYQKLAHAGPDAAASVLEQIRSEARSRSNKVSKISDTEAQPSFTELLLDNPEPMADQAGSFEYFDPDFISQSRVEYESNGAYIDDMRIESMDRMRLNNIICNKYYIYKYTVHIKRESLTMGFGMALRTVTGFGLAGAGTHFYHDGMHVRDGDIIEVSFPFKAIMNAGVYFMNAGCGYHNGLTSEPAHRVIDGFMFRVHSCNSSFPQNGIFDISDGVRPATRLISSVADADASLKEHTSTRSIAV